MGEGVLTRVKAGLLTFLFPPARGTGGTDSARYCYSVYLRHLAMASGSGLPTDPKTVVELGPGDSLGTGMTALLTGAERYFGLDLIEHATATCNVSVFDELVKLLSTREAIPAGEDLEEVKPDLDGYSFPHHVLDEARMARVLTLERVAGLRAALLQSARDIGSPIVYSVCSRFDRIAIPLDSADLVFSQAVMEHVDAIEEAYAACFKWLKPGGFMSHQIDLRSHDTSSQWNGHWCYSDLAWWAIRGARPWYINRLPWSAHVALIKKVGFEIVLQQAIRWSNAIPRERLARRFRRLTAVDLETAGVFIRARKPHR